jgi:hypothetical protein
MSAADRRIGGPLPGVMPTPGLSFVRAWLYAGATIAVLDIADALIYYGLRGIAPHLIFQSIASGVLGRSAFKGGTGVQVLGACLHCFNAFTIAFVYLAASRRLRTLAERPWLWGPTYGVAVWFLMYFVVLPLSAHGASAMHTADVIDEIAIHILGVGLPAALFARAAAAPAPSAARAA